MCKSSWPLVLNQEKITTPLIKKTKISYDSFCNDFDGHENEKISLVRASSTVVASGSLSITNFNAALFYGVEGGSLELS